jgi:ligand-binding sensor domain-containing protein
VTGPGGYTKTVTATDTLHGLSAGNYIATAAVAVSSDSLVGIRSTGTVTGSPATVVARQTTAVTAAYTVLPGSGMVWLGWTGSVNVATGYTSAQLAAGGALTPTDTIGSGGTGFEITSAAFDTAGNLWVTNYAAEEVFEFTAAQLASGVSTPAATITLPGDPWGLAFDASGNLWLAVFSGSVQEFSATQLAGFSGIVSNPTPTVSLSVPEAVGVSFDNSGNMWASDYAGTIYEFTPAAFAVGGSGTPSDSIVSSSLVQVTDVAFDASGNMWAGTLSGLIVNYTAAQLASATPPTTPNQTISSGSTGYAYNRLAFDNSGNLWTSTYTSDLAEYSPAQLAAGGSPTPSRTLTNTTSGDDLALAFNPHASGLPVAGQRTPASRPLHASTRAIAHGRGMILVGPTHTHGGPTRIGGR